MNKFTLRGNLYWFEFAPFIWRNINPVNTHFRVFGPSKLKPRMVTLMDYNQPYKKGLLNTSYGIHADWERDSIVVNCGWDCGEIPIIGIKGNMDTNRMQMRGARQTVEILCSKGVLLNTAEVAEFLEGTESAKLEGRTYD